ncbi:MAG: TolC family protein [Spirochaetales bacterium]|nr:MAG: TolC family protein [Spirochaetales bacterium]
MTLKITCLTAVIALATVPLSASETIPLRDVIRLAIENNNSCRTSIEAVEESRFKVRESWGMLWPSLSTDVSYTRQGADAGFNANIDGRYEVKFVNGQITVNPGVFYNTLQASRNAHIIAENNVRKVKGDTVVRAIQSYYRLLLAREGAAMREESIRALEENLKTVTIGYNKGIFSRLDYLRAQVAFANEKTQLINAENDALSAMADLNIQIGNDIFFRLDPDPGAMQLRPEDLSALPSDADGERRLLVVMIGEALRHRPEVIQIKKTKEMRENTAAAAEAIYLWPSFFASGSYGTSKTVSSPSSSAPPPGPGEPGYDPIQYQFYQMMSGVQESFAPSGWNNSWSITAGASYRWGALSPLDFSHARGNQSRSSAKQTEFQMDDFIKSVKLEIQRGYLKLKAASTSIASQQGNVKTAEESLKVAVTQFRNGIIDNTKLIEANVQLITARTLYIQSLYDFQVARAELNRAIGVDYFPVR